MSLYQVITGWLGGTSTPAKLDRTKPGDAWRWGDGPTFAGERVTPDSTMSLSAAWSCVRLNARTIGSLPLKLYERNAALERKEAADHPLAAVIGIKPNADQGAMEFWEGQITALNLRGNAYARIARRGDGQVIALWPLSPDSVTVYRAASGERRYNVTTRTKTEDLAASEIFHLRGFGAGGDQGLSPIGFGRQTLANAIAAERVSSSTFAGGLQLAGFIQPKEGAKLTDDQFDQLAALFEKFTGSDKVGKVMPLHPGMEFKPLRMTAADAQLLESRRFSVEEICRWFGVFPILVGHASQGQTMWGSGIEQLVLAWLTLGLGPELTRIEEQIVMQLLTPADQRRYYPEHIVEGLLRADSAARAALYASLGQNGVMTRNEMRAKENLTRDPGPGADMLTAQSNLVPLDQLGQQPAGGAPADQMRSAMMNLMFGGDLNDVIDARLKAMIGHNGGPRLED